MPSFFCLLGHDILTFAGTGVCFIQRWNREFDDSTERKELRFATQPTESQQFAPVKEYPSAMR